MGKIKKIGILFSGRLLAIYGGGLGLVFGVIYSFGGAILDIIVSLGWITSTETPGLSYGTLLAFLALVGMPLIFAFFGFLMGLFGALIFNYTAKITGGLDLDIELDQ
jgi:hypothetical protein